VNIGAFINCGNRKTVRSDEVIWGIRVGIRVGSHRKLVEHRAVLIASGRESAWRLQRALLSRLCLGAENTEEAIGIFFWGGGRNMYLCHVPLAAEYIMITNKQYIRSIHGLIS